LIWSDHDRENPCKQGVGDHPAGRQTEMPFAYLSLGCGALASLLNDLEHLFDDLRVQGCDATERDRHSQGALAVDAMTAL
jgi:hypothetical protein